MIKSLWEEAEKHLEIPRFLSLFFEANSYFSAAADEGFNRFNSQLDL